MIYLFASSSCFLGQEDLRSLQPMPHVMWLMMSTHRCGSHVLAHLHATFL